MAPNDQRPQESAQNVVIKAEQDAAAPPAPAEAPPPSDYGVAPGGPGADPSALVAALASLAGSDSEAIALLRAVLSMQSEFTAAGAPAGSAPIDSASPPSDDAIAVVAQLRQENEVMHRELQGEREMVLAWRLAFEEAQRSVEALRRRVTELERTVDILKAQATSSVGYSGRGAPVPQLAADRGGWAAAAPPPPPSDVALQRLVSSVTSLIQQQRASQQPQQHPQQPGPFFRPLASAAPPPPLPPTRPPLLVSMPQSAGSRPAAPSSIPATLAPKPLAPQRLRGIAASRRRFHWTPELHEAFKRAVDQLGGAAAATPKAIFHAMQMEELTLDRIKSHLQKYRLKVAGGGTSSEEDEEGAGEEEEGDGVHGEDDDMDDGEERFLAAQRSRWRRRCGSADESGGDAGDGADGKQAAGDDSMAATLLNLAAGS